MTTAIFRHTALTVYSRVSGVAELETQLLPASTLHKTSPLSTEYTAKVQGNMFYNPNLQFKYISLRGSELYSQVHILFY